MAFHGKKARKQRKTTFGKIPVGGCFKTLKPYGVVLRKWDLTEASPTHTVMPAHREYVARNVRVQVVACPTKGMKRAAYKRPGGAEDRWLKQYRRFPR